MTTLSTHVLDTAKGHPGSGIEVTLQTLEDGRWSTLGSHITDSDGRVPVLGHGLSSGIYRLVFDTGSYGNSFFPEVHLVVTLEGDQDHYHVPLLISDFGYTTYRGS